MLSPQEPVCWIWMPPKVLGSTVVLKCTSWGRVELDGCGVLVVMSAESNPSLKWSEMVQLVR